MFITITGLTGSGLLFLSQTFNMLHMRTGHMTVTKTANTWKGGEAWKVRRKRNIAPSRQRCAVLNHLRAHPLRHPICILASVTYISRANAKPYPRPEVL
jgi:hypothetical protein